MTLLNKLVKSKVRPSSTSFASPSPLQQALQVPGEAINGPLQQALQVKGETIHDPLQQALQV